jgi:hypothetical protein
MTDQDERPRGVLSPADRAYLRNPDEFSRQASHARAQKIQERLYNAILDFGILSEELDSEGRRRLLTDEFDWYDIDYSLPYMIAFAHNLIADEYDNPPLQQETDPYGHKNRFFEIRLQDALEEAYLEHDLLVKDIELSVESEEVPGIEEIEDRLAAPGITTTEIEYLVNSGEIDGSEMIEFVADQLDVDLPDSESHPLFSGDDG